MALQEHVSDSMQTGNGAPKLMHLLDNMQSELAKAVHDVNNPLAIISGNAQLLIELMRELSLDPEVEKSVADIEEASVELARRLSRLSDLREEISLALDGAGSTS
jgi:signal transduction histidine kinase